MSILLMRPYRHLDDRGLLKDLLVGVWRVAFISLTLTNTKNITINDINAKLGV